MSLSKSSIRQLINEARAEKYAYADIQGRFEAENAANYGQRMPDWVPDYGLVYELMLDAIVPAVAENGRIADLGAGTGRLARRVLERYPTVQMTLVDFSSNMLSASLTNLADYEEQVERITADFHTPTFALPTGQYDAIVSAFAICHGQNEAAYRNLYQRLANWLKPGGIFINFDHILGGSNHFTVLNAAGWADLMAPNFTQSEIEWAVKSTYQEDSPLSLWQHLQLMDEAGLTAVDVLWKKHIFAIYAGVKPS